MVDAPSGLCFISGQMKSAFKTQLKKWRGQFSQSEAAKRLGVPVKSLQNWEQGRYEPAPFVQNSILRTPLAA